MLAANACVARTATQAQAWHLQTCANTSNSCHIPSPSEFNSHTVEPLKDIDRARRRGKRLRGQGQDSKRDELILTCVSKNQKLKQRGNASLPLAAFPKARLGADSTWRLLWRSSTAFLSPSPRHTEMCALGLLGKHTALRSSRPGRGHRSTRARTMCCHYLFPLWRDETPTSCCSRATLLHSSLQ